MKKNRNKWVVSLASAALVASAIVPVASAVSFTDVEKNDHKDAILALAEAGIISGYPDGTFRPNAIVTRGNITKLLGKWLVTEGYEIPKDYNTVARFSDLPVDFSDQELVQYAALVKDVGVFKGSNNQLMHVNNMSREHMAVVLVRAINTVYNIDLIAEYKAAQFESNITDLDKAMSDEKREAITALEYKEITIVKAFNPKNILTRGQFASFLNRSIVNVAKEGELAAKEVEAQIKDLPADKDILEQGNKILSAKIAYEDLTVYSKKLVSEESKAQLDQAVSKFILFNKSDINGLQLKIAKAETLEAKQAVVEAAKENLEIAKALGITDAEYNFLNDIIVAGEKTIINEAVKEVEAQINDLPADKDILDNGKKILNAKIAYESLTDSAKALVKEESKEQLDQAVSKFILFNKSDINGLQPKLAKAETLEAKQAVVEAAKENLEIAKALGITDAEYNFLNDIIIAGEKTIASGV